jgi:hypothetical protein
VIFHFRIVDKVIGGIDRGLTDEFLVIIIITIGFTDFPIESLVDAGRPGFKIIVFVITRRDGRNAKVGGNSFLSEQFTVFILPGSDLTVS